jgi:hypothetical protein
MDFKKKQREEAQKLKEAKERASQKGPMGGGGIKVFLLFFECVGETWIPSTNVFKNVLK